MEKKILSRTLIVLFAVVLGTQVLFGQALCDLLMSMPCCMDGQGSMPQPSKPATDCCFIVSPEAVRNLTPAPSPTTGHNESKVNVAHSSVAKAFLNIGEAQVHGPGFPQSPLSVLNTPAKLSVFRI